MAVGYNPWMEIVTCSPRGVSRGIWLDGNPLEFSVSVFMVQIALASIATGTSDFFLRRFGFCSYFSHMIGAIMIGPTVLGKIKYIKQYIFSPQSIFVLETFHFFCIMYFSFLVGLKMDIRMVKGLGRKPIIIGASVGFLPTLITYPTAYLLKMYFFPTDAKARAMLQAVGVSYSQAWFHVVACFLSDLKILNSEIGRLAIATSMISNACSLSSMLMLLVVEESGKVGMSLSKGLLVVASMLGLFIFILYILKPIMHWIIKQIPQGSKGLKEIHVFMVFLMVLVCAYIGHFVGHAPGIGPLILGLVVPPGPPLAETIEDKLESIVSTLFLPLFYAASCGKVDTGGGMELRHFTIVALILFLAFSIHIIGAVLSSLYCGASLNDSLVLALIIASPGVMDVIVFSNAVRYNYYDYKVYTILIYTSVAITGITSILVKVMYKPSEAYLAYKRRTLTNSMNNTKLRILTCIYQDFDVPSIINLLAASNATDEGSVSLYLLHLIELQRIAPPFIIIHKMNDDRSINYNRSKHIINAFRFFVQQYNKRISLKSFTALSPCETMHQDICSLAADKSVDLIILPFHRQINLDGIMEAKANIRNVNSSVLKLSPCSVGILIDRRCMNIDSLISRSNSFSRIALIFLGGADDREVLTFAMRMVENANTTLTVIRFSVVVSTNSSLRRDKKLDAELLDTFRRKYIGKKGVNYKEEEVLDSLGIVKAMREIDDWFDLIMVGRQHGKQFDFNNGLSEWSEYSELGFMGDMLATSNLQDGVPILVLQQKFQDFGQGTNYRIDV